MAVYASRAFISRFNAWFYQRRHVVDSTIGVAAVDPISPEGVQVGNMSILEKQVDHISVSCGLLKRRRSQCT